MVCIDSDYTRYGANKIQGVGQHEHIYGKYDRICSESVLNDQDQLTIFMVNRPRPEIEL